VQGYMSREYAAAFAEFGAPRQLARSGGWLIERAIAGTQHRDAMGCYPLFGCADWSALAADLDDLKHELVSVALVADPFGKHELAALERAFDVVRPFKQHFIADLHGDWEQLISRHHRYYARRALREARVEICDDPPSFLEEWLSLYEALVSRHELRGLKAFSRESFARQLRVPGLVMFRMIAGDMTVGGQLWFVQRGAAYNHLQAASQDGYTISAAYGLCYEALRHFAAGKPGQVRWLDLGAGAGLDGNGADGLTAFKRGWSSETRPAYFCGRIFDRELYDALVRQKYVLANGYFPAYRQGEFA